MDSFEIDRQTVLKKNTDYWMEEPNIDTLIFKVITDSTQAANALQTGEIDIAMDLKGESVQVVEENADLTLLSKPGWLLIWEQKWCRFKMGRFGLYRGTWN